MMTLFLRHAEAEAEAEDDFSRTLTGKGIEQAQRVGKFCARLELIPEVVLSSPVVRARQTADIVARKLGVKDVTESEWLACGMAPETCIQKLGRLKNVASVMLVGHEPDFGEAVAALLGCGDAAAVRIRKACLVGMQVRSAKPGGGVLEFCVPARLM